MPSLSPEAAYAELLERSRKLTLFCSAQSLLGWDQRTYMPAGGSGHRAAQFELLSGMAHEMATAPRIGELLAAVEGSPLVREPDSDAAVNVRELRRSYGHAVKIPRALVEALAKATSESYVTWVEARKAGDYRRFQPCLERLLPLVREKADALGWQASRYDALLDLFEPGMTKAQLQALFPPLERTLTDLLGRVAGSRRRPAAHLLDNEYPLAAQEALAREAATRIGFNFAGGRLDPTAHPFCCTIGPGDTRLTTRFSPRNFGECLFSVLHEAGHGLYGQGLDPAHYGTPRGRSVSLGIHESQSRMWENLVGRSRAFWQFFLPRAQAAFPSALGGADVDGLGFAVNEVKPSFIRVEADETTYNLHVSLRFELEVALVEGHLQPADLPGAWNEGFERRLGLKVPDAARGCLQDVHWSEALVGYFPTYTLGNLYAAQFFAAARRDLGDLDAQFARGEFRPLLDWLRTRIHRQGQRYRAARMAEVVTGQAPSAQAFLEYLRAKLAPLYGL